MTWKKGAHAMKRILFLLFISILLSGNLSCGKAGRPAPVSPVPSVQPSSPGKAPLSDEDAIRDAGLDKEVIAIIRKETSEPFERLMGSDEEFNESKAQGVVVKAGSEGAEKMALKLRPELMKKGYISYITDVMGDDSSKMTIMKGTDPYDILVLKKTNGINYEHSNADVIAKLKEWEKRCPFVILGASMDWVQLELAEVPPDCDDFAKEVYRFCPDIVDQGTGSVEELSKEIKKSRRLFLWWD
jgi:hypothetical protein